MRKEAVLFSVLTAVGVTCAEPVLSGVSFSQDEETKLVTVTYRLDGDPAVVTMTVETNGVPVGGSACSFAFGDVSKRVEPDAEGSKTIYWQPMKDMPNWSVAAGDLNVTLKAWATNAPPDYMVVDLDEVLTNAVRYYETAEAVPLGVTNDIYKTQKLLMRKIPATEVTWCMGRNASEVDWSYSDPTLADAELGHLVTLSTDYYIGVYEFTQKQWAILTGGSWPSPFQGDAYPGYERYPVSQFVVNWNGSADPVTPVQTQLAKLNARTGLAFDLPTEAQWEYACRAGDPAPIYGDRWTRAEADEVAWHGGAGYSAYNNANSAVNGTVQPHVVGLKKPNAWGLYDMLGNVWEVCRDYWYRNISDGSSVRDPETTAAGPRTTEEGVGGVTLYPHVRRGGDYRSSWSQNCRSSARFDTMHRSGWWGTTAGVGFRPACTAVAGKVE